MSQRAIIYARVSSDDRKREGRNLAGQLEMCRRCAAEHGWEVVAELAEDDRGASGASFDLPELNRALEMAQGGAFDILVVREIDRLSRKLAKQLVVEAELTRHGVQVEYVIGDFPDSPEGRLNKHIRATVAEFEREKIRERMTRGKMAKAKAGSVIVQGRPPYGYRMAEDNGKATLVVHEPEAQIVRMMYGWYAEGNGQGDRLSLADITRKLSKLSVPTFGDRKPHLFGEKKRGHGQWCRTTVHRMLRNETYAGVWRYNKTRVSRGGPRRGTPEEHQIPIAVPAIVSRQTWEAVQARLERNRYNAAKHGGRKHPYLVGGRVTCGVCGLKMAGAADNRKAKRRYYRCPSRHRKIDLVRECDLPSFRADHVDAAIWCWVRAFLMEPASLARGLRNVQADREREHAPLRDRLTVVGDLLAENNAQLERLLDLYLSGEFAKDVLTDRKARLEQTIRELEKEQAKLAGYLEERQLSEADFASLQAFAAEIAEGLEVADADFQTRRRVIEALEVQVTLVVEDGRKVVYGQCVLGQKNLGTVPLHKWVGLSMSGEYGLPGSSTLDGMLHLR